MAWKLDLFRFYYLFCRTQGKVTWKWTITCILTCFTLRGGNQKLWVWVHLFYFLFSYYLFCRRGQEKSCRLRVEVGHTAKRSGVTDLYGECRAGAGLSLIQTTPVLRATVSAVTDTHQWCVALPSKRVSTKWWLVCLTSCRNHVQVFAAAWGDGAGRCWCSSS